jgi:hypothetical protein
MVDLKIGFTVTDSCIEIPTNKCREFGLEGI